MQTSLSVIKFRTEGVTWCDTSYFFQQIDKEREGEQIDRALLKNVLDIFVEIGLGQMDCYENDFEDFLLKDTTEYYSVKAQSWILEDSCPDYMIKVPLVEKVTVCSYIYAWLFLYGLCLFH